MKISSVAAAGQQQSETRKRVRPGNPFVEVRAEEIEQSIPVRFEQQVDKYPDHLGVVGKQQRITYGELNQAANRLARAILAQLGEGNELTAFLLGPEAPTFAAILGILKAGKALVGLDPASPFARNAAMLEHSQAGLVVTDSDHLPLAKQLAGSGVTVMNIDELDPAVSGENVRLPIPPDALATVVYTSGSTGQPKGVMRNHRNLLYAQMVYANRFHIGIGDRAVVLFSLTFSAGVNLSLHHLLSGACLCTFNIGEDGIQALASCLIREEVTILQTNPTTFRHFIRTLSGEEGFSKTRLVYLGGEVVYPQDVEMYKKHFAPGCLLANGLASSEMTAVCQFLMDKETQIKTSVVPVGYEHPGARVLLWDEAGQDVGVNRVGQMVVKSRYLSPGYWRDPGLTKAAFLPDPEGSDERLYRTGDLGMRFADGCLIHLGRKDDQVKIRGYRVEVVEVETALLALDSVKEAVVVPRTNAHGEQRLVAYWVPASRPAATVSKLRRSLADRLPSYMMPSAFVVLESLPLGDTGKVDRKALPEPSPTRPALAYPFGAPRNEVEARLTRIWEDVLGIQPVGVLDSFSDLGGDSLGYLELMLRVEEEFGRLLPLSAALQAPTVEQMARLLDQSVRSTDPLPDAVRVRGYARYLESRLAWIRSPRALLGGVQRVLAKYVSRGGASVGSIVLSYRTGSEILSWMSSQQWIQSTMFRHGVHVVQQCLASVPQESTAAAEVVRLSIASNACSGWRILRLSRLSDREFEQWVRVIGLSTFVEAFQLGRGVVLVRSHVAPGRVVLEVLRRAGFSVDFTVGLGHDYVLEQAYGSSLWASKLSQASRTLQRGGVVGVAPDGDLGTSAGIEVPFFGRKRIFRSGFAELAVSTGAPVIPVSVAMDAAGHVDVRFLPPLEVADLTHHRQVESLILQYVEILRKEWKGNLASVRWKQLERFLQLSPASKEPGETVRRDGASR